MGFATGKALILRGHAQEVNSVAWSPDGLRLVTGSADGTAKVWDTGSGQELGTLGKIPDACTEAAVLKALGNGECVDVTIGVNGVAWSPDGKRLATASGNSLEGRALSQSDGKFSSPLSEPMAKVWDASNYHEIHTLHGHRDQVTSVAWSPDSNRLATGSADRTARVWEATSGKELIILKGHTKRVTSVAWSPDGKKLATGSEDKTTKVWDAVTGQELLTLGGHMDVVTSVAWSPDGKRLASASNDGTVQVYTMDIHELLQLARSRVGDRKLAKDECLKYFQSETCPAMP